MGVSNPILWLEVHLYIADDAPPTNLQHGVFEVWPCAKIPFTRMYHRDALALACANGLRPYLPVIPSRLNVPFS